MDGKSYGDSINFTSATSTWDLFLENMILSDLQPSATFFDSADPMIDTGGLGESWINMQEWADLSFQIEPADHVALQDIQDETKAAGGVRFCCYGMVSGFRSPRLQSNNILTSPHRSQKFPSSW
jgi:hypothetical protein